MPLNENTKTKFICLRLCEKLYEEVLSNGENTIPAGHNKIRECKWNEMLGIYDKLAELVLVVKEEDSVRLMKEMVLEFKSKNSVFEEFGQ